MLYILTHSHYNLQYNLYNEKFIWVFSSKELVDCIIWYKSRNENGFKDYPEGFETIWCYVDEDKNFVYKLWKTKLYLIQFHQSDIDKIQYLGIYSSKKLAKEKFNNLSESSAYNKQQLEIRYVVLDLELWREWFISISEALDSF